MEMVVDAILLWDGLILATFTMDERKYRYFGYISGWFEALRGTPWLIAK